MRVFLLAFGFSEHTRMLGEILADRADVTVALPDDGESAVISGVTLRPFADVRLRDPAGQVRVCSALRREIHRAAPDVLHIQQGHLWFNAVLPTLRPPVVLSVHDHRHHVGDAVSRKTPQWVMDFGFRRAGRLMVHSEAVKRGLIEVCEIPAASVDVLPPPLTGRLPETFTEPPCDPPTILFFGRLWPYKGLGVLLRAQPIVSRAIPEARFVIAGQGESLDGYRRQMADGGCFRVINRWIGTDERAELFRAATLVVLPYLEATQSGILPVAFGHARAVVATRVGAIPEVVKDGETGLLVPPDDEEALAAALIRLLRDTTLQCKLSSAARAYAERELSPARMADATIASYERLVAGDR
jgi:glycosyltransferase involved in cell wall biosynthesis